MKALMYTGLGILVALGYFIMNPLALFGLLVWLETLIDGVSPFV